MPRLGDGVIAIASDGASLRVVSAQRRGQELWVEGASILADPPTVASLSRLRERLGSPWHEVVLVTGEAVPELLRGELREWTNPAQASGWVLDPDLCGGEPRLLRTSLPATRGSA